MITDEEVTEAAAVSETRERKSITRTFSVPRDFNDRINRELEFRKCELSELIRYALSLIMQHDKPVRRR